MKAEKEAKNLAEARVNEAKEGIKNLSFATKDSAFSEKTSEELNIIIKSDVHGSAEAIKYAISNIKHDEVKTKIILSDIGMVTETDITLAKASNAAVIAFNVKPSKEAKKLAEKEQIKILEEESIKVSLNNLFDFPNIKESVDNKSLSVHGLIYDIGSGDLKSLKVKSVNSSPNTKFLYCA